MMKGRKETEMNSGKGVMKSGHKWADIVFSILSVLMICLYPVVFLYTQNAAEAAASEMLMPAIYFCGAGILVFAVLWLVIRSPVKAGVAANISMLALLYYAPIESALRLVVPSLRYWHCIAILLYILIYIAVLIAKKLPLEGGRYTVRIISGVAGLLILLNVGMAIPVIAEKVNTEKQIKAEKSALLEAEMQSDEYLPNIYYIILDEYAGFDTIQKIYDYNNEPFAQHLEELGFSVSRNSVNGEISTRTITANLIDLSYNAVYGKTTIQEENAMRQDGKFFQLLSQAGYSIQGIGESMYLYDIERADVEHSSVQSATMGGETFAELLYQNTVYYPFSVRGTGRRVSDTLASFTFLKDKNNFPESGMLTMAHLTFPHTPFIVGKDGEAISTSKWFDWIDKQYYLGQYIFCTKCITEAVDSIIARDPNSIIILQSDHGPRAANYMSEFMRVIPYEDMKNILNAVYYAGDPIDEIIGQSGVNTLRLVLNRLLNLDFEILEVPYGSYEVYAQEAGLQE